jgi:hypothetical protein
LCLPDFYDTIMVPNRGERDTMESQDFTGKKDIIIRKHLLKNLTSAQIQLLCDGQFDRFADTVDSVIQKRALKSKRKGQVKVIQANREKPSLLSKGERDALREKKAKKRQLRRALVESMTDALKN